MLSQEQFVDLYELLGVAPDSDAAAIRGQINKLYTEAQRNLDHHNFRKRFYYQELFEIHLPQAHQFLLNDAKRAEYDRCLVAFKAGQPLPETSETAEPEPAPTTEGLPAMRGDDGAPAPVATSAGLPTRDITGSVLPSQDTVGNILPAKSGDANLPAVSTSAPPAATPPAARTQPAGGALPGPTQAAASTPVAPATAAGQKSALPPAAGETARATMPAPAVTAPVAPVVAEPEPAQPAGVAAVAETKPWRALPADEVERRRDYKRRELIKSELEAAGRAWSIIGGVAAFVVVSGLLFLVLGFLSSAGGSLANARGIVTAVMLVVGIEAARQCGKAASRSVRRKVVATLSRMPYDELLRRCAS